MHATVLALLTLGCTSPVQEDSGPADADTGADPDTAADTGGETGDPDTGGDTDTADTDDTGDTGDTGDDTAPAWETAAEMPTARGGLCTAFGADGRLYAFGGISPEEGAVDAAEAWDPDRDAWLNLTPLPEPRYGCAAVLVPDGRIVVVGGQYDASDYSRGLSVDALAYDPTEDRWEALAPMPRGRYRSAAVVVGDAVWAIGGFDVDGGGTLESVDVLDLDAGTWSTPDDTMARSRSSLAAAVATTGDVYVFGGQGTADPEPAVETTTPGERGWFTLGDMPAVREGLAAVPWGDDILVVGGQGENATTRSRADRYVVADDRWEALDALPVGRYDLAAAVGPDGRVHVLGGLYSDDGFSAASAHHDVLPAP